MENKKTFEDYDKTVRKERKLLIKIEGKDFSGGKTIIFIKCKSEVLNMLFYGKNGRGEFWRTIFKFIFAKILMNVAKYAFFWGLIKTSNKILTRSIILEIAYYFPFSGKLREPRIRNQNGITKVLFTRFRRVFGKLNFISR